MGGGDLNTKKSWHPNTMKNQERVWKAEQAAAEEKKRILELQREREEENDRAQLKEMAQRNFGGHNSGSSDNRLHWMYDKPDKQTQQEDYLLGKAIGKNDEGDQAPHSSIPALSRRVVGSSMTTSIDNSQVDLARKLREDPLLLVKERERAARAALLNNPLQRKKLTELLRKEQELKDHKDIKKKKKKKGKDLDDVLAAKLNALAGNKGINLNSLLDSDDSTDSSSSDEKSKKKKKKRKHEKKTKRKRKSSESEKESSVNSDKTKKRKHPTDKIEKKHKSHKKSRKVEYQSDDSSNSEVETKKKKSKQDYARDKSESQGRDYKKKQENVKENYRRNQIDDGNRSNRNDKQIESKDRRPRESRRSPVRREGVGETSRRSPSRRDGDREFSPDIRPKDNQRRSSPKRSHDEGRRNRKQGLSEEEKAARLAEMAAAGMEREEERGQRVARQRAEDAVAATRSSRAPPREARALPESLESRIHSNRHYIQRDHRHMNEHFARR